MHSRTTPVRLAAQMLLPLLGMGGCDSCQNAPKNVQASAPPEVPAAAKTSPQSETRMAKAIDDMTGNPRFIMVNNDETDAYDTGAGNEFKTIELAGKSLAGWSTSDDGTMWSRKSQL